LLREIGTFVSSRLPVRSPDRLSLAPVIFAAALAVAVAVPPRTDDLDWHLAVGRDVLEGAAVPRTNRYSFTAPDAPWIHHAWGGSVVLALVDRGLGWPGLVLLAALATAASVTLVYARSRSLVWTALAAPLLLAAHAVKPHALATTCAAAFVWLLADERRSRGAPLLLLPWANLHGSFVVGLALLAAHDAAARRPPLRTLVGAALCCVSPYGPWVFVAPARYALDPELRRFLGALGVWQPPAGAAAVLLAAAIVVGIVLAVRAAPPRRDLVVAAVAAAAAWTALHHVALLAVLAAPAVASRRGILPAPRLAHAAGAIATAVLAVTLVLAPPARPPSPVPAALLAAPRPARLLHPFDWGGALLAAGVPVAIDARNDCYPARVRADALALERRGAVAAFVRRYQIDGALAPADGRLDRAVRALGFRELRRARGVVLFAR
jgi:hypothetical protein